MSQQDFAKKITDYIQLKEEIEEAISEKITEGVKEIKQYTIPLEGYITVMGIDLLDAMKFAEYKLKDLHPSFHIKPQMGKVEIKNFEEE